MSAKGMLVIAGVCCGAAFGWTARYPSGAARTATEPQAPQYAQEQLRSLRGLQAAASVTGSYVGKASISDRSAVFSVGELIPFSDLVLIGTQLRNQSRLSADGREVFTDNVIVVESVLKGEAGVGDELLVATPGGRVSFPDGTWAQLNAPGFRPMREGRRYLLFLRDDHEVSMTSVATTARVGRQIPVAGPLGVYELDYSRGPQPNGGYRSALARSLRQRELTSAAFVSEVREAIARARK